MIKIASCPLDCATPSLGEQEGYAQLMKRLRQFAKQISSADFQEGASAATTDPRIHLREQFEDELKQLLDYQKKNLNTVRQLLLARNGLGEQVPTLAMRLDLVESYPFFIYAGRACNVLEQMDDICDTVGMRQDRHVFGSIWINPDLSCRVQSPDGAFYLYDNETYCDESQVRHHNMQDQTEASLASDLLKTTSWWRWLTRLWFYKRSMPYLNNRSWLEKGYIFYANAMGAGHYGPAQPCKSPTVPGIARWTDYTQARDALKESEAFSEYLAVDALYGSALGVVLSIPLMCNYYTRVAPDLWPGWAPFLQRVIHDSAAWCGVVVCVGIVILASYVYYRRNCQDKQVPPAMSLKTGVDDRPKPFASAWCCCFQPQAENLRSHSQNY